MARKQAPRLGDADVLTRLAGLLDGAAEPLAISKAAAQFKGPYRRSEAELSALAEAEVAAGRLFRFAPFGGTKPRYWTRELSVYAARQIEAALAKKPLSFTDLEKAVGKRLKDLSSAALREIVDGAVRRERLHVLPPLGRSKPKYSLLPIDPADYVRRPATDFRKKIEKIAAQLAEFGVSAERTIGVALELCGAAALVPPATRRTVAAAAADFPADFDSAFAELDRRRGCHNLVSLVELRRALPRYPREEFDRGLRALRLAGRYTLSAAESVNGIRPEDRAAGIEEAGTLLLHVASKSSD